MGIENYLERFRDKIKKAKLKQSSQRDQIVQIFFETKKHIDAETLYSKVKQHNSKIGHTTVYRTLKLLCDFKMAKAHNFSDNITLFEPVKCEDTHHDHIICVECGKIEEFKNETIEELQIEIANRHNFQMTHHVLQIYGVCSECQKKGVVVEKKLDPCD